ncbi:hypothetical protein NAT51_08965 [Flavobacterium amniphilum]|uniref:hypothetical protein n=1 Tax=Flavobacterium amniphilum TaxID=1834035 RepID=UPI00202A7BB2|nr:hypothetical protein [Flavobacterium amniphilum]MCL9805652.1 hypothetical protein [Flavobacterium amniphilum]
MKKLFVTLVLLLSVTVSAQQELDQKIRTGSDYKKELSVLKLTLDQEPQYFQIVKKYIVLNYDLQELNIPSTEVKKREDVLEEKKCDELKNILSLEQLASYKKLSTERITADRAKKRY